MATSRSICISKSFFPINNLDYFLKKIKTVITIYDDGGDGSSNGSSNDDDDDDFKNRNFN